MYKNKKIAAMMPGLNEEKLIGKTIEAIPDYFDYLIITDDGSSDRTYEIAKEYQKKDSRIIIIKHEKNMGVGYSLVEAYKKMIELGGDIAIGVGCDFQMPMEQVPRLLDPIIEGRADFVKGSRFMVGGTIEGMPKTRIIGNTLISAMCKISSGYWKMFDVVDGFSALSREAIQKVDWEGAWSGYGYPMEHLVRYNIANLKVMEVPRRAIYLAGERQSQIKGFKYFRKCFPMMMRMFFKRMWRKYIVQTGHPLAFLYITGIVFLTLGAALSGAIIFNKLFIDEYVITGATAVMTAIFLLVGFNAVSFGMFFDMLDNEKLQN